VIRVDELLELGMQEICPKLEALHFRKRPIRGPALVGHPIDRRHHARAVPSTLAVDVDRLVRRIVDDRQELLDLLCRWRQAGRHRDTEEFHPQAFDDTGFTDIAILREIDDRLDAEAAEISVIASLRLRAAKVVGADAAEVVDADAIRAGSIRLGRRRKRQSDRNE